ncbi:hypothetical protein HA402_001804 [Bradysia odoriphaga]|nr:hypothetical protein HA402_001804 [Bradysia odoriphaga]
MFKFVVLSVVILLGLIGPPATTAMNNNLTAITWAHAVNNQSLLDSVLSSDIQFIEADIVLGTLIDDATHTQQPIMAHPPANTSDISLDKFLTQILNFNKAKDVDSKKGVKLDFKSIDVFEGSLVLLRSLWESMNYPVWINADILPGPVNSTGTPVDADRFLAGCKSLTSSVLSIGWTTRWGNDFTEGAYNDTQIDGMIDAIKANQIIGSNHSITFPVRAGIAAQSQQNLHRLVDAVNEKNNVTLTIWSSAGDSVNVDLLRKLIFSFGVDKVYVDVPEELLKQLDLGNAPARASSIIHFGMITIVMLLTSSMFSNCQFS